MPTLKFTVDSALLRELGERLVGRPHIALAELIKNAYDADATETVIRFADDRIEVVDNGHGMTRDDFRDYWMRIGSPHKESQTVSRRLKRPLTGSKGVGRLSAQFLANRLELRTVSDQETGRELIADVDWQKAIETGDLTEVEVDYRQTNRRDVFPTDTEHGTRLVLTDLNHAWSSDEFRELAREIWTLQPPFRPNPRLKSELQRTFAVNLESDRPEVERTFDSQMGALLSIWTARLVARLVDEKSDSKQATIQVALEFRDGERYGAEYSIAGGHLHALEFEIRVFTLKYRQPFGVQIDDAREYFRLFGGVHVYDAGFHLPYYGPDADWLRIEMDHAHRLSRSALLPDELQVPEGISFLPTNSRLFGVVNVDTALERRLARKRRTGRGSETDSLVIQVTRDRLVDNRAFRELRDAVRWALDFYAVHEARRQFDIAEQGRDLEPLPEKARRVDEVLERYREDMPEPVYAALRTEVEAVVSASQSEAEAMARQVGLLGTLATAGISALAYEHEAAKQFQLLDRIRRDLVGLSRAGQPNEEDLRALSRQLGQWLERARATRALFSHLLGDQERDKPRRLKAKRVVENVVSQTRLFVRRIDIDTSGVPAALTLPPGRYAEWTAIFQNVLINAANAMLDSDKKRLRVRSEQSGEERALVVEDTGVGVDLATADHLFEPFERRVELSPERRALGLGGSGLGLTIVRMLASNLDCRVGFVEPSDDYATAFRISWREQ
jgi:signal transduction histidine kinase